MTDTFVITTTIHQGKVEFMLPDNIPFDESEVTMTISIKKPFKKLIPSLMN